MWKFSQIWKIIDIHRNWKKFYNFHGRMYYESSFKCNKQNLIWIFLHQDIIDFPRLLRVSCGKISSNSSPYFLNFTPTKLLLKHTYITSTSRVRLNQVPWAQISPKQHKNPHKIEAKNSASPSINSNLWMFNFYFMCTKLTKLTLTMILMLTQPRKPKEILT